MMNEVKAMSLDEMASHVRNAFYEMTENGMMYDVYMMEVYDDYAIVMRAEQCYKVPYTMSDEGVTFAASDTWEAVEKEWIAAKAALIHAYRAAGVVKAVQDGEDWILEVLGNPFGNANTKDAHGEYFSEATDFHFDIYPPPPIVEYHAYDPATGRPTSEPMFIGKSVSREKRSDGIWYRVILDKANAAAKKLWDAAKAGLCRASSGSVPQLVRVDRNGHIKHWPVIELSLMDLRDGVRPANTYAVAIPSAKAIYKEAGLQEPAFYFTPEASRGGNADAAQREQHDITGLEDMNEKELQEQIAAGIAAAMKAEREAAAQAAKDAAERQKAIDDAVAAAKAEFEAQYAKDNRLPDGSFASFNVAKHSDLWKYDNLEPEDLALMVEILDGAHRSGRSRNGVSKTAYKALAIKLFEDKTSVGDVGRQALKMAGSPALKADEIMQQDLTTYGDEWVGVSYSQRIWERIRQDAWVLDKLPSIEVPAGMESIYLPLEGADPVFYKVAEVTDLNATTGRPNFTVTASRMATGRVQMTLAKMGARVLWSGELEEDSLIPFVNQLRQQLQRAGAETMEHVVIDGDTATGATTNINDIGSTPAGTEAFLLVNGFRKSPLVTTTANSRSGTTLAANDYLETVKLMGLAGQNAVRKDLVTFIPDLHTYWKSLELPEVKTRDVNVAATIENGNLTRIYGYDVRASAFMHWANQDATYGLKANTAGKVDLDTASNNTTGSILAVRWDQWLFGWRRRMTIETSRYPESDANQIVLLARFGLVQRDTEAAAISYNITL